MFGTILIANRGEIACRIARTARRLGVRTVAVYSEADASARHVRLADEAVCIGPAPARESYLSIPKLIDACRITGAEAVHPGYGFLSENADFAQALADAGIALIGPPIEALRTMGLKSQSKALMQAAGVPVTPGYHGDDQDPSNLRRYADAIGYPLLIKASAGGGGKGMRVVERGGDFPDALASCQREAMASFGDDRVLLETYIQRPRHIEIQIFADTHGQCLALFERDCSLQRRHQKVIEEAPAPGMTAQRRGAMSAAAIAAAQAVAYVGAGTVEFIVQPNGQFYFMEMNTRLQVEHPVTEMITGLDLVEWQLLVAAGEPLPKTAAQIALHGHAIEARIYAEDPAKGFLPSTGRLIHLRHPEPLDGVRIDSGVDEGDEISPHYDPMIAKLIVWDNDRERARLRMLDALHRYRIVGVSTNIDFLQRLITSPAFANADVDTGLIERNTAERGAAHGTQTPPDEIWLLAALAEVLRDAHASSSRPGPMGAWQSPWSLCDAWRINGHGSRSLRFSGAGVEASILVTYLKESFTVAMGDRLWHASGRFMPPGEVRVAVAGRQLLATVLADGKMRHVYFNQQHHLLSWVDPLNVGSSPSASDTKLAAPMPGRVIAIVTQPGATVARGQALLVIEAMKMEHTLSAPYDGIVRTLHCAIGDVVVDGIDLIDLMPLESPT